MAGTFDPDALRPDAVLFKEFELPLRFWIAVDTEQHSPAPVG